MAPAAQCRTLMLLVLLAWLEQRHVVAWNARGPHVHATVRVGPPRAARLQDESVAAADERPGADKVIISPNLRWVPSTHWLEDADRRAREDVNTVTVFLSDRVKSDVDRLRELELGTGWLEQRARDDVERLWEIDRAAREDVGRLIGQRPPVASSASAPPAAPRVTPAPSTPPPAPAGAATPPGALDGLISAGRTLLSWATWQVNKNARGDIAEEDLIDELRLQAVELSTAPAAAADATGALAVATATTAATTTSSNSAALAGGDEHPVDGVADAVRAPLAASAASASDSATVLLHLDGEDGPVLAVRGDEPLDDGEDDFEDGWADIYFDGFGPAPASADGAFADAEEPVFELVDTAIAGRWRKRRVQDAANPEGGGIYFDSS